MGVDKRLANLLIFFYVFRGAYKFLAIDLIFNSKFVDSKDSFLHKKTKNCLLGPTKIQMKYFG